MESIRKFWQPVLTATLFTLSLGMGSALAYQELSDADSCCQPGAPCCKPGAPCCAAHHAADQHSPQR